MRRVQRATRVQKRFFNVPVTLTTSHELLDMHPQVQRAQVCNKFGRSASAGPPLHSGGPQKLNLFRAGWSLPQKSVPAALLSFAGLHVGTTILTPRIRVVLSTFDMSAAADHSIIHQHSLSFKTVHIVDHEPRAARRRVKEALHIRTDKNPMNKDKGLELEPIWFSVFRFFSTRDRFYANFPNSGPSPKLLRFFYFICLVTLYLSFLWLLPSSCFLVTPDTLRLIHKTPTSKPNVTFQQLRRDNTPHLPDTSRKSTSWFKKVGIFFLLLLTWKWLGQPGRNIVLCNTDCWCVEEKVLAMNTQQEPPLKQGKRCPLLALYRLLFYVQYVATEYRLTCQSPFFPNDIQQALTDTGLELLKHQ